MHADFESALQAQIIEWEERQSKLRAEIERIEAYLGGLRQALSLYRGEPTLAHRPVRGSSSPGGRGSRVPDPSKSEAWAFALSKLEGAPESGIDIDDLAAAIAGAGYEMSRNTLRANLSNAAKEGIIERVRYGRYRRELPGIGAEPPISDDESGDDDTPATREFHRVLS
jgi:hypothetical protein